MLTKKFIRPTRPTVKVRKEPPSNLFVPAEGCWVVWSSWYQIKLREKSIIECEAPVAQKQNTVTPVEEE